MRSLLVLTLLLMGQGVAWAVDCPPGTFTTVIGEVSTGNDAAGHDGGAHEITQQGQTVRMVTVTCAGTGCRANLYDTDTDDSSGVAGPGNIATTDPNIKAEPGSPANESRTYSFDPPLQFKDGITFHDDGNVNALFLYTCR